MPNVIVDYMFYHGMWNLCFIATQRAFWSCCIWRCQSRHVIYKVPIPTKPMA